MKTIVDYLTMMSVVHKDAQRIIFAPFIPVTKKTIVTKTKYGNYNQIPTKTYGQRLYLFKDPRKALSEPDNVVEPMTSGVNGVYHFKYYSNDWDYI